MQFSLPSHPILSLEDGLQFVTIHGTLCVVTHCDWDDHQDWMRIMVSDQQKIKVEWTIKVQQKSLSSESGLIYNYYYYWYRTSLRFLVILYLLPGINLVNNKGSCTATYNTKTINRPLSWRLTRMKENECRFSDCVSSMVESWVGSSWGRKIAIGGAVCCLSGGHWCCCCVAVNPRKGRRDQRSWLEENLSRKSLFVALLLNALHTLHLRLTWRAFSPSLWITTGR